jgi:hypothetical protein
VPVSILGPSAENPYRRLLQLPQMLEDDQGTVSDWWCLNKPNKKWTLSHLFTSRQEPVGAVGRQFFADGPLAGNSDFPVVVSNKNLNVSNPKIHSITFIYIWVVCHKQRILGAGRYLLSQSHNNSSDMSVTYCRHPCRT